MTTLASTIAEHTTTVFLNTDHFAESYTFESNTADDVTFNGIFDRATLKQSNADDANSEYADATLTISVDTYDALVAAVADFEMDGWITIAGQRYSIAGEIERDAAMVTVALSTTKIKTLRKVKPHGR